MRRRIRLLPLVICVAGMTLMLKLGSIWHGLDGAFVSQAVAESKGEDPQPAGSAGKAQSAKGKMAGGETANPASSPEGADRTKGDPKDAGKPKASDSPSRRFDPSTATEHELELLERLASRRVELEQRARELELREATLQATERQIDAKIAKLSEIKDVIEGVLKKHETQHEAKLKSLVKIYENMKPKSAARIFQELEMDVLLDVIERMRETKTAPIMANMRPAKAKALTAALAARRSLPELARPKGRKSQP